MLKILYYMPVYKDPEQVSRVIQRLYSPSDFFYVHRDKRKEGILRKYGRCPSDERWKDLFLRSEGGGNVLLVSKYKTARNSFKLVEATLDAMKYFRKLDYDYFITLTGQCYPIKPVSVIKEELERRNVAYMEFFKLPSERWAGENGGLNRLAYYYVGTGDEGYLIRIPRLKRTLPYDLQPYGGSVLSCLPHRFVDYVLDYVSNHPKIVRFYRTCYMSPEMFFQTIIMNSELKNDAVNSDGWYIRWSRESHPAILRKEDFNDIIKSDKLFARKFDISVDSEILDLIDREIHRDQTD